jgi:hypothetical protein
MGELRGLSVSDFKGDGEDNGWVLNSSSFIELLLATPKVRAFNDPSSFASLSVVVLLSCFSPPPPQQ